MSSTNVSDTNSDEPDASAPNTGQISVAELLARNGAQGGAAGATSGGRRRRGVKGGISVAELTGEIPIIRDDTTSTRESRRVEAPEPLETREPPEAPEQAPEVPAAPAVEDVESTHTFTMADAEDDTRRDETDPELGRVLTTYPAYRPEPAQRPEPARTEANRSSSPSGWQQRSAPRPVAEPELLSGSTTVAGDLLNQSHDDSAKLAEDAQRAAPDVEAADKPDDTEPHQSRAVRRKEHSPGVQWLSLIGQSVVAIVIGALLFAGFTKLWVVLPWVALVMAILVIIGLVAIVRILRRTDDLISILLAIVVGAIVTLGPLALQLSTG